jgi:hypothetical protein
VTDSLVYNIPARQIDAYRACSVIIRSSAPEEIAYHLRRPLKAPVLMIQLLGTPADTGVLEALGANIPIEIVLADPVAEYAQLYNYANLLDTHPVRVAVPVLPGFSKAARLAVSLDFAVKLEAHQPDEPLIQELMSVLGLYLHRNTVRQPIEFFQSVLLSFYRHDPISLWEITDEDPVVMRYITDDGEETISRRFIGFNLKDGLENFVLRHCQQMLSEKYECHGCEYFSRCGGYFKWPESTYDCGGVKELFRTLENAAAELKRNIDAHELDANQLQP